MDREKVINGLECCCEHITGMNCDHCPYDEEQTEIGQINQCTSALAYDALAMLKEQQQQIWEFQELNEYLNDKLQSQPQIVRCKDCVNANPYLKPDKYGRYGVCEQRNHIIKSADWFCADGERR